MKGKNILIIILAVILTGSVVFLSVWLSKNWGNVKKALNGTNIYTQTDLDNAYSDGYTTGLTDKAKLTAELADAKSKLADAQDQLSVLSDKNADLTADNTSLKESLDKATAQIDELKAHISYLEKLLESYGNIEKIAVSYWVDNECVNVELIDAGTTVAGYEPILEDWQIFQGWALKDSADILDLTTKTFSTDTDLYVVTDRQEYTVKYYVYTDDNTRDTVSQSVKHGDYSTAPTTAERTGYTFLGWAVSGTTDVVDITTYPITSNVVFISVWEKIDFVSMTWNGLSDFDSSYIWTDGSDIFYSFDNQQYVLDNESNTWNVQKWNGLTSFRGNAVWTIGTSVYYSKGTNQYVLDQYTDTWTAQKWNGLTDFNGYDIWTDDTEIYYSAGQAHYVLNSNTFTWSPVKWANLTYFYGSYIWSDGINIYYSYTTAGQYILDNESNTWNRQNWNGFTDFTKDDIWTDGVNIYCSQSLSNQYVLDNESNTWVVKNWNGFTGFHGRYIWTDGINIYYSRGTDQYIFYP